PPFLLHHRIHQLQAFSNAKSNVSVEILGHDQLLQILKRPALVLGNAASPQHEK
ncbi:hypothetical protein BDN71DRAFT_1456761, partial [Pleurotus eryngii]